MSRVARWTQAKWRPPSLLGQLVEHGDDGAQQRSLVLGVSSARRRDSHASRERRSESSRSMPALGERDDRLPPVGRMRAARVTRPRSSRVASTFVIDGGCTRSHAASSPALIGPCLRSVAIAESWVSVTDMSTRWLRINRVSRNSDGRSSEASSAGVMLTMRGVHIVSLPNFLLPGQWPRRVASESMASPERPEPPQPPPVDSARIIGIGTAIWFVAFVALLPCWNWLARA